MNSYNTINGLGDFKNIDYLVVGCGFYGSVISERIATCLNKRVLIIDVRTHVGGNSYSYTDSDTGIEVHKYGSHIFHTSNSKVWNYITGFDKFNSYQHKVYTNYLGKIYCMPINLHTINQFFNKSLSPLDAKEFLYKSINIKSDIKNLEEKAISLIGKDLYNAFIKGYTTKQWGKKPSDLPADIITRLPVRFDYNNRYFSDTYEGQPLGGYGALFNKILTHPNILVSLGIDYFKIRNQIPKSCKIIYTGPIDRFFDYQYGVLGWRTSNFQWETLSLSDFQGTSVMNYSDETVPFTRIHEFKHYHPERVYVENRTIICKEFSAISGKNEDPYYPINTLNDKNILRSYKELSKNRNDVIFGGRLGNYVYIDMHQAIAMALNDFDSLIKN
jgi:UDP-galactopyranose mutase